MSAQPVAVFGVGTEPPPESSEPSRYLVMSLPSPTAARSAWVICPILSAVDMRDIRSATRVATGRVLSR